MIPALWMVKAGMLPAWVLPGWLKAEHEEESAKAVVVIQYKVVVGCKSVARLIGAGWRQFQHRSRRRWLPWMALLLLNRNEFCRMAKLL